MHSKNPVTASIGGAYLDFLVVHGFVYTAIVVLGPHDRLEIIRQQQQGGQHASSGLPASLLGSQGCSRGEYRVSPAVVKHETVSC